MTNNIKQATWAEKRTMQTKQQNSVYTHPVLNVIRAHPSTWGGNFKHTAHTKRNEFFIFNKDCERLRRFSSELLLFRSNISLSTCIFHTRQTYAHTGSSRREREMIQNCEFDLYCTRQLTIKLPCTVRTPDRERLKCALIYSTRYDNKRRQILIWIVSPRITNRRCVSHHRTHNPLPSLSRIHNNKNIGCDSIVLRKCRHLKYNDPRIRIR